ncbi:hypothetical protein HETIRDRAFT_454887 [Heterobasidion irregulare TC 32-1]|uniref:Uncharacterized protein n=1 Tax=Heterobasidion irregulare (strain TC 32-1) TaxID=747525 RepID=W4JVR0_HETIT|nr:uncharacterized protein HETIRDRAFT_454887 [Heterobasidion irregulare TC 32-1]ETW77653.1 hypothetical protein HETIRDRAFT_454887 [Heterobasidion irregulare TC 32-1]
MSEERINAIASWLESLLEPSRKLHARQVAAQSTISMLKSKFSSPESLVQTSQTVSPPRPCACSTPLLPALSFRHEPLHASPLPAPVPPQCTHPPAPAIRSRVRTFPRPLEPTPVAYLVPSNLYTVDVDIHAPAFESMCARVSSSPRYTPAPLSTLPLIASSPRSARAQIIAKRMPRTLQCVDEEVNPASDACTCDPSTPRTRLRLRSTSTRTRPVDPTPVSSSTHPPAANPSCTHDLSAPPLVDPHSLLHRPASSSCLIAEAPHSTPRTPDLSFVNHPALDLV